MLADAMAEAIAGVLVGMRGKELFSGFAQGIRAVAPALPLIVIVIAIAYILTQGKIMSTIAGGDNS